MAETLLGIDLRADRAHCVQIHNGLKGRTVSGKLTVPLKPASTLEEKALQIRRSLDEAGLVSDGIVLGLPSDCALVRTLSFPFTSMAQIRKVAPFELGSQLPLPIESTVYSLQKTEKKQLDNTQCQNILAAAISRNIIDQYGTAFRNAGLEPDMTDLDAGGINALALEVEKKEQERSLYLDIGPLRTSLVYRRNRHLEVIHSLKFAAQSIVTLIASHTANDADFVRDHLGELDLDTLDSQVSNTIRDKLAPLLDTLAREINNILFASRNITEHTAPQRLVISGELANFAHLSKALSERMELPIARLSAIQPIPPLPATLSEAAATGTEQTKSRSDIQPGDISMAALGLALRGLHPNAGFNFCESKKFASRSLDINWKKHLPFALATAGGLLGIWLFTVWTDISLKKERLNAIQTEIHSVFDRIAPGKADTIKPSLYPQEIMNRIDAMRKSRQFTGSKDGGGSMSDLLRDVNAAIPTDLPLRILELRINGGSIRIAAHADTFRTVDAIKEQLVKSGQFDNVTVKGAKAAPDGKGVRFSMEFDQKGQSAS